MAVAKIITLEFTGLKVSWRVQPSYLISLQSIFNSRKLSEIHYSSDGILSETRDMRWDLRVTLSQFMWELSLQRRGGEHDNDKSKDSFLGVCVKSLLFSSFCTLRIIVFSASRNFFTERKYCHDSNKKVGQMSKELGRKFSLEKNGEKNLVGNNFCPFCLLTHVTHFELFTDEKF